jgi:hypothetical protein
MSEQGPKPSGASWPPNQFGAAQGRWQPHPPALYPPPQAPYQRPPGNRWGLLLVGAVTTLAAVGLAGYLYWYMEMRTPTLEVQGELTLHGTRTNTVDGCHGRGGYADIRNGTEVIIRDGASSIVGITQLEGASQGNMTCTFTFHSTIPGTNDFYTVEVTGRGKLNYDRSGIRHPSLTLGDK